MLTLPPPVEAHEPITSTVDGVKLTITYHYNARDQHWRIDVADADGAIVTGRKLCPGRNPLLRSRSSRLPLGEWWFSCPNDPPGRDAFDDGVARLVYFAPAEVAILEATATTGEPPLIEVD